MNTARNITLLLVLTVVFVLMIDKALAFGSFSLKNYPKFDYTGGQNKKAQWYAYAMPLAKVIGKQYGIPWKFILVHTALETGWGASKLFRDYNNWGGIKALAGESTVQLGTVEYYGGNPTTIVDGFRVWNSPYEGIQGYGNFFHVNPRYASALNYPNDPYQFAVEIKQAGYATDPNFVSKIHNLLNKDFA